MKNNSKLHGAGTVFRYTVQQHYKTPSVLIFLAILLIASLAVFPVVGLIHGGNEEVDETKITTLYLRNETGFSVLAEDIHADARYQSVDIVETTEDNDALAVRLADEPHAAAAVLSVDATGMLYTIKGYYGMNSQVTDMDVRTLNGVLEDAFHESMLRALFVTDEQVATLRCQSFTQVASVADYGKDSYAVDTDTHVAVNLIYSYAIMILSALAMSYIFQLCMEEKVSKLVESLLVSVSPMALLLGKILAVTFFLFAGIAMIIVGLIISWQIATGMTDMSFIPEFLKTSLGLDLATFHISGSMLLLMVPCALLAYAICACFSGVVGSCCSKTEDTQQASLAVVLFLMIGYMAGVIVPMMESDAANYFCALFPLTSIFTALPNFVCGKISLVIFIAALLLQCVTMVLLARLAGTVYQMMLLYRGSVPKPAQLIRMLKENRAPKQKTGKEEAE